MARVVSKSIAIIGEGETEWFYFDSLRVACRFPFKVAPDFPQHSDIRHVLKLVESYIAKQYIIAMKRQASKQLTRNLFVNIVFIVFHKLN